MTSLATTSTKSLLSSASNSLTVWRVPTVGGSSTWYASPVRFPECLHRQRGPVGLTRSQSTCSCQRFGALGSPYKLACSSHTTVPTMLSNVPKTSLWLRHGVRTVNMLHVGVEEDCLHISSEQMYRSILRLVANESSIRTDDASVIFAKTSSSLTSASKPRDTNRALT